MDLKQQLVVWKRSGFILDHVTLSPPLCERLVDEGLLSAAMMTDIHSQRYRVEQTLKMLTYLGSYGDNVFDKFIKSLRDCRLDPVAKELTKTHKHTRFGEILPPAFTYFLDLSEFLRKYRHIGHKLGEEGKHLLQSFIEGKIEMEHRKLEEGFSDVNNDREKLKQIIASLQKRIENMTEKETQLKERISQSNGEIEMLNSKIKELELLNQESRTEVRRLQHFRMEQEQLQCYIGEMASEYGLPSEHDELLTRMPTITNFATGKALVLRMRFLLSQINLSVNKLYYMQVELENLDVEENKLTSTLRKGILDKEASRDAKKVLADTRKERKNLAQQVAEAEKEIYWKEKEIEKIRKELVGKPFTPQTRGKGDEPDSLKTRMGALVDAVRKHYRKEMRETEGKHGQRIAEFVKQNQELQVQHQQETDKLKFRIKQKMVEIHKREMLHKRMRNQIGVITRYHAKNMNSTIPADQCRKIVRGIIRDVRNLKDIAEEKDKRKQEEEEEAARREKKKRNGADDDDEDKKGKKKKKKRKKWNALANERLMYVADRMQMKWRQLGRAIGMTSNRMDMVEFEAIGKTDAVAFMMLKTWRDEDNGRCEQLVNGLKELGRPDLALIVTPAHRVEIVQNEDGTFEEPDLDGLVIEEATSAPTDNDDVVEMDEDEDELDDADDINSQENMMAATPRLPPLPVIK